MKNTVRFFLYVMLLVFCSRISAADLLSTPEMKRLLGCWNNADNQHWEYGFFEKFAIYHCDLWEYKSIKYKKNKAEIILQRGDENIKFNILFNDKSDSICTIISPKEGRRRMVRHSTQPDYTTQEHSTFIDNGYQPDSVTLIGYLRNTDRKQPFEVSINNILSNDRDTYYADMDSLGCFRMTVPIVNTTGASLDWHETGILIPGVFEPGDTLFLYYDYEQPDHIRFMGKNARLYHEIRNYRQYSSLHSSENKYIRYDAKIAHDTYLQKQQELYKEENELFNSYLTVHPLLSDKFKQYMQTNALTKHINNLMQRRFALRRNFNKEFLSPTYMEYVDQLFSQVPPLFTLSNSTSFLINYLDYYNSKDACSTTSSLIEITRYLNKEKGYPLSEQQKSDFKAYEQSLSISMAGRFANADSLLIDSLAKPFQEAMLRADALLKDSTLLYLIYECSSLLPELMEVKDIKDNFYCFDHAQLSPILKEWKIALAYYEKLYNGKKALSERSMKLFNSNVSNVYLRDAILKSQESYQSLEKQDIDYIESLKKTDHLKESKDADKLFKELITPYKGKVIYLDIWGTWCGPCKREMTHMPAIKKAMADKDVIFMYLANRSPEESWKNVIKESKLTGPNVVHYNLPYEQQSLLERRLSINSFPTYILIDKEGNIVDMHAPYPHEKKELLMELEELLTK